FFFLLYETTANACDAEIALFSNTALLFPSRAARRLNHDA
ncbi:hypothetical protein MRX96_053776, partial [Rhipicephalus microplus]